MTPPPVQRWFVVIAGNASLTVRADELSITEGGVLAFHREGLLVKAFAPGTWVSVQPATPPFSGDAK